MRKKTLPLAAALLTSAVLALSACGGGSGDESSKPVDVQADAHSGRRALTVLDPPFTKPDLVLTDTHGEKYDLRERTKGRPTLLYFGYTHCPDICPLTMSNIAVAKKQLPKAVQEKLRVVFVTTDPERDTPAALGSWLRQQDPEFIGLTGKFATIQHAARQLGISIDPPKKEKDGTVVSTHGTEVVAFSPKSDGGYLLYHEDATVDDYTKDLPKIVQGQRP
ncbi:SCO family protein [Streptomyces sulfonofaciens]|uniref:SCO family protein n=1 Tax=Streptomyces sulfonofaciens TaxID=68272 RepID=A0A919KS30_9ACTN|nr:SCO family protein [Streptomyces sulfonofaciens]GHH69956.1 SCO family protein [Streptomyces sulfonofaciens]